ncbi:hypothetical protein HK097_005278, partial [Rhizophlyctis rosea]
MTRASRYKPLSGSPAADICPSFRRRKIVIFIFLGIILLTFGSLSLISSTSDTLSHLSPHASSVIGGEPPAPQSNPHINPFRSSEILYFPGYPLPKATSLFPFSATYVINRPIRSDRREGIISLAHYFDNLPLHITAATEQTSTLVSETRTIITTRYNEAVAASQSQSWWNRIRIKPPSVSNVELAVWASHARIWKEVETRNLTSALVLEDDVDAESFMPKIVSDLYDDLPQDWDVVYL